VAHKQVRAIYHELLEEKSYQELGGDFFDHLNQKALEQRLTRRLEDLGYRVELSPVSTT
jgi:hypothetical protein